MPPTDLHQRLYGTRRSKIIQELFTNTAHYPIANILLESLLLSSLAYFQEGDFYVLITASLIQAYFLGSWQYQGTPRPLLGNLIAPLIYIGVELLGNPHALSSSPHYLSYFGFALVIGGLQQLRLNSSLRMAGYLILLESIVRTNILWVTFLILHSLLETNYQFSQFFNDKTHIFLVLVTNLIGVMMGVANRNAEIFLVLLNHTNKQLHRYSEWFLGKDVLEMAITDPASLSLSRRERAVLFMDIRGFTRWSESQSPEKVVEMLNNYGETAEQCWLNSDAIKVKFTGDEIMIVFQSTAHALKVAQCMRHSIRALLESYGLGAGIGIHHGALVEGLVGSHKVKAYDIIGDTVNTAKRICDAAARGELLISQQAYDTLAIQSHTEELRALMVKGKSEAVVVHVV